MARVLNVYQLMAGIEKYVVSGAVAGLTAVAWHDEGTAFTDGSTIHLPRPNAMWDDEQLMLWRYKAEHELGHEDAVNSCPHWKEVQETKKKDAKYKDDGLLWWIVNLISDHVQEHNRVGEMIGRDEVLYHGREAFLSREVFKEKKPVTTDEGKIATGLFLWDTEHRMKWNSVINNPPKIAGAEDVYNKLKKEATHILPDKLRNEMEVFNAAVELRKLFPEIPPTNNFMNALGEGEGEGAGKGGKKKVGGTANKKWDECPPFFPTGDHGKRPKNMEYDYKKGEGVYIPRFGTPLAKTGKGGGGMTHISAVSGLLKRTNLPAKVRAYLMAMQREKMTTGWRSGKLDTSRLTDALRGKEDLFRRKEPVLLVDSAVSLLVDSSGSMSGQPFQHACASAIMLAEALQGIKVSVEVAGFTEFGSEEQDLIHDIWLPFGRRFVRDNVLKGMAKISTCLSNNVDGENILYAYQRLLCQKQSRKILIVLSDGEPSGSGPNGHTIGPGQFTKNVCEQIEKDKRVLLVGLGMSGYAPDRFYKNAYHVEYGQALEPVLLKIVQDAVLRH